MLPVPSKLVNYVPARFEVTTFAGFEGDAFTRKYIT